MKHILPAATEGSQLLQLLRSFVAPADASESDAANGKRRVVMALSSMAHSRSEKTNFVQTMLSRYQYASGVPERPILCMNHLGLGVSCRTLGRVLEQMAKYARGRLRRLGPFKHSAIFVFDNLTVPATVRYARLYNNSELLTYTAGYALLPPCSRQPMRFLQKLDLRIDHANAICVEDFIPTTLDLNNIHLCLQALMLQATQMCARYLEVKVPDVNHKMPSIEPIDIKEAPRVHPLPTYDYNKAIVDEVIEILNSIKEDVGITPCQAEEELFLFFGDLLTVQNIRYATICFCMASAYLDRKAQVRQSECLSSEKLQWIETSMRLFHFEMAILGQIFKNFYRDRMDR